jgi:hypothetical protein
MAGGSDEQTSSGEDDHNDDEETTTDGDATNTALVYPVPDDLRGLGTSFIELVSTPNPDGDTDNVPQHPGAGPGPNPVLRGIATFALHNMPRMSNTGILRLGFMGGAFRNPI